MDLCLFQMEMASSLLVHKDAARYHVCGLGNVCFNSFCFMSKDHSSLDKKLTGPVEATGPDPLI